MAMRFSGALRPQRSHRPIRDGEPRTATSTVTQLLSSDPSAVHFSVALRPQIPYGLLGTGSPERPPPLSHTAPELCSAVLYVQRDHLYDHRGHLDFHTALELCKMARSVLLYVHRYRKDY